MGNQFANLIRRQGMDRKRRAFRAEPAGTSSKHIVGAAIRRRSVIRGRTEGAQIVARGGHVSKSRAPVGEDFVFFNTLQEPANFSSTAGKDDVFFLSIHLLQLFRDPDRLRPGALSRNPARPALRPAMILRHGRIQATRAGSGQAMSRGIEPRETARKPRASVWTRRWFLTVLNSGDPAI